MDINRLKNYRQQLLLLLVAGLMMSLSSCIADITSKVIENDRSSKSAFSQVKKSLEYSEFIRQVEQGKIKKVGLTADRTKILLEDKDGIKIVVNLPPNTEQLIDTLTKKSVEIYVIPY